MKNVSQNPPSWMYLTTIQVITMQEQQKGILSNVLFNKPSPYQKHTYNLHWLAQLSSVQEGLCPSLAVPVKIHMMSWYDMIDDMIWLSDLLRLKAFIWPLPAKAILTFQHWGHRSHLTSSLPLTITACRDGASTSSNCPRLWRQIFFDAGWCNI